MSTEASEVFKILGVENRIRIIELLRSHGPLGVNRLSEIMGVTPAAISQHLKALRHAGLVTSKRRGYWIPYSVDEEAMEQCRSMVDNVCPCGCRGKARRKREEITELNVSDLKAYEKELQRKLEIVRDKISQIDSSSK